MPWRICSFVIFKQIQRSWSKIAAHATADKAYQHPSNRWLDGARASVNVTRRVALPTSLKRVLKLENSQCHSSTTAPRLAA
jgi:hypothetical protein